MFSNRAGKNGKFKLLWSFRSPAGTRGLYKNIVELLDKFPFPMYNEIDKGKGVFRVVNVEGLFVFLIG